MKHSFILLILLFFLSPFGWAYYFLGQPAQAMSIKKTCSDQQGMHKIKVQRGDGLAKIARQLEREGWIRNSTAFLLYAYLKGQHKDLKAGEYEINCSTSAFRILDILVDGQSVQYSLTIPEGSNIYEIAILTDKSGFIKKEDFLRIVHDKSLIKKLLGEDLPSLEGYLFPETYHYTKLTAPQDFIGNMVDKFFEVYKEVKGSTFMSRKDHVILASIIEKETGSHGERKKISSVFHNRLKKNMKLQTDPTIIYGMIVNSKGSILEDEYINIRRNDINRKTDYNTYRIKGLPKGPIANPGKAALEATVNPDRTKYLFFVSRNDGSHHFSKTLKEHNKAVRKYQLGK